MKRPRRIWPWACLGLALGHAAEAAHPAPELQETWRFTHARPAPWGPAPPGAPNLAGKTLAFTPGRLRGPGALNCDKARAEHRRLPAEGLFQGNLPAPAQASAQTLGLSGFPVDSLSISCADGVFDFHRADGDTLLIGLDNRVWTLSRAPGAKAPATAPEGTVERLLEAHFGGDMGFSETGFGTKRAFLSRPLQQLMAAYFARPVSPDEAPAIDGDPFTDSQEYPTRFAVGKARTRGGAARVPVRFADGWRTRRATYALKRERDGWRVDDVLYDNGESLRGLLK